MRKFMLVAALCAALVAPASAAVVTLNWTAPAPVSPNPTDITGVQIWDLPPPQAGVPVPSVMIGSVAPTVTTITTPSLAPGAHTFTAVAVYGEGSAAPSNTAVFSISVILAPVTNLTGTVH